MKELEITREQLPSATVLHAVGAVDSNTAPELQQALLRATETSTGGVELDLAKVKLINVPLPIKNVLNLTGFATFIDVSP
ncbi:MAG: hypothetical protein K0Q83_3073 [Deltaproteobacteria bacterium]|nr:hypothetical protein [Deltaproteobacteria bacterium]